ncbi:MAG: FHA domain-containing protein [Desulfobacter sp.]|nr:MAG: FHA domain-containing protein [Desulfobacter sp.]
MNQPLAIIVQLVHIHGPLKGGIQEFDGSEITIGRHPSSDLVFPKDLVVISRNHARIQREGNRFKIIDTSTNGTFVNGSRVTEAWLKNGDVIFFTEGGPKVSFLTREGVLEDSKKDQGMASGPAASVPPSSEALEPNPPAPSIEPKPRIIRPPRLAPEPEPMEAAPSPAAQGPHQPISGHAPVDQAAAPGVHQPPPTVTPPPARPSPAQPPVPPAGRTAPDHIQVAPVKIPLVIQYGALLKSFSELPITLGKGADCDLVIDHPSISGPQVQIFFSQGCYMVKDLTGKRHVLINSQPLPSPVPLAPDDQLFLTKTGPAFTFLEGGRMMEIDLPKPPQNAAADDTNQDAQQEEAAPKEKSKSLFGKLFR